MNGAEEIIPVSDNFRLHGVQVGYSIMFDQGSRILRTRRLADKGDDLNAFPRSKLDRRGQHAARIEPGSRAFRQWCSNAQSSGINKRPVATDEFAAIAGPACLPTA